MRLGIADEPDQLSLRARRIALHDRDALALVIVPVLLAALDDVTDLLGRTTELVLAVVDEVPGLVGRWVRPRDLVARGVVGVARVRGTTTDVRQSGDLLGI